MPIIAKLSALEILDSRGRPTIRAHCHLAGGLEAAADAPSGASTGRAEARELRDGDPTRYRGLGCRRAVNLINKEINAAVSGHTFETQEQFDRALVQMDGTPDKSRLGANTLLALSLAFARASARELKLPLYFYFAGLIRQSNLKLPRLATNLFSGGKHAGGQVPIQDLLVIPISAASINQGLEMIYEIFQCAAELTQKKYGLRFLRADEGGLAPPFIRIESMFEDALQSIEMARLVPGKDVVLGMDTAASHFYRDGTYHLGDESLSSQKMIERLVGWTQDYPIVSVEDGLAEEDWIFWPQLRAALSNRALTIGDDLLCTNPARIQKAIDLKAADGLLLKLNQVGTLTEAAQAYLLARGADWRVIVSARSGDTEDDWLADLAVGWAADQVKIGSLTQSERLSKYNRLLEIESETGFSLASGGFFRQQ